MAFELVATTDMKIVGMIQHQGRLFIGCEHAVYVHEVVDGEDTFKPIKFVTLEEETT